MKNAVNHGLNFYNLPEKDLEFVRKAIGNGTTVLIQRCTPSSLNDNERLAVFNEFKSYYLSHYADYTKPYPGIKELLEKLEDVSNDSEIDIYDLRNFSHPTWTIEKESYFSAK